MKHISNTLKWRFVLPVTVLLWVALPMLAASAKPLSQRITDDPMYFDAFPDDSFCAIVLQMLNEDGGNRTVLSIMNADDRLLLSQVEFLYVQNMNIKDLTGLSYFSGLKSLVCNYNSLKELDVSHNALLEYLYCSDNELSTLNTSKNPKLKELLCGWNPLIALDVSQNSLLESLQCYQNKLTVLDVSANPELNHLRCSENQLLALNISNNPKLRLVDCNRNKLSVLDVWQNTSLNYLSCDENLITELDISHNSLLEDLYCGSNQLKVLDVSNNLELKVLGCGFNQIDTLNITQNIKLESLFCALNQITELDISHNPLLGYINCGYNQLSLLDVSHNPLLRQLLCRNNYLTGLDVSHTVLEYLDCIENFLPSPADVIGWQELGLEINSLSNIYSGTFLYYIQKIIEYYRISGTIYYQPSPIPATITLSDSTGIVGSTKTHPQTGTYTLFLPTGLQHEYYTLTVTKPGYLTYTIKNIPLGVLAYADITQLAGDLNDDGVVNAEDLTILLAQFNKPPQADNSADIDGNGIVNAVDLTYLLAGFNKHDVEVQWLEIR